MTIPRDPAEIVAEIAKLRADKLHLLMRVREQTTYSQSVHDEIDAAIIKELRQFDAIPEDVAPQGRPIEQVVGGCLAVLTGHLADQMAEVEQLRKENKQLKSQEPGTPRGRLAYMCDYAEKNLGHSPYSAKAGETVIIQEVERLKNRCSEADVLLSQAKAIIVQQKAEIDRLRPAVMEGELLEDREDTLINRMCEHGDLQTEVERLRGMMIELMTTKPDTGEWEALMEAIHEEVCDEIEADEAKGKSDET